MHNMTKKSTNRMAVLLFWICIVFSVKKENLP